MLIWNKHNFVLTENAFSYIEINIYDQQNHSRYFLLYQILSPKEAEWKQGDRVKVALKTNFVYLIPVRFKMT